MKIRNKKRNIWHPGPGVSRRRFLQISGATAGTAALGLTFAPAALGGPANQKVLVYVFLRGGIDGLSLLPPVDDPDYGHLVDARDRTLVDILDSDPGRRPIPLNNGQRAWAWVSILTAAAWPTFTTTTGSPSCKRPGIHPGPSPAAISTPRKRSNWASR